MRFRTAALLALVVMGCALSHRRSEDAGRPRRDSAAAPDSGPFVCRDGEEYSPTFEPWVCDEEAQRLCQLWAQGRTDRGYARSSCRLNGPPNCQNGDTGCERPYRPGDHWPPGPCYCGDPNGSGRLCYSTEVCISDTPDGEPYCVPSCGNLGG